MMQALSMVCSFLALDRKVSDRKDFGGDIFTFEGKEGVSRWSPFLELSAFCAVVSTQHPFLHHLQIISR